MLAAVVESSCVERKRNMVVEAISRETNNDNGDGT